MLSVCTNYHSRFLVGENYLVNKAILILILILMLLALGGTVAQCVALLPHSKQLAVKSRMVQHVGACSQAFPPHRTLQKSNNN